MSEPVEMVREAIYSFGGAPRGYVIAFADEYGVWWTYETLGGARSMITWPDKEAAMSELPTVD
jgi:hypothetical protein